MNQVSEKRAWLAILFTLFGGIFFGYFYIRRYKRGLILLGVLIASVLIPTILLFNNIPFEEYTDELDMTLESIFTSLLYVLAVIVTAIGIIVFACVDVYILTKKYNQDIILKQHNNSGNNNDNSNEIISERDTSKRVWLSMLLSLFSPGLGHMYLFQYKIGVVLYISTFMLYTLLDLIDDIINIVIFAVAIGLHIFSVIHSYIITRKHNMGIITLDTAYNEIKQEERNNIQQEIKKDNVEINTDDKPQSNIKSDINNIDTINNNTNDKHYGSIDALDIPGVNKGVPKQLDDDIQDDKDDMYGEAQIDDELKNDKVHQGNDINNKNRTIEEKLSEIYNIVDEDDKTKDNDTVSESK